MIAAPTFVKMFAPSEKPMTYNGLLGNVFFRYPTVTLRSSVNLALNSCFVVILLFAHPRALTTHAAQPPAVISGASTARR